MSGLFWFALGMIAMRLVMFVSGRRRAIRAPLAGVPLPVTPRKPERQVVPKEPGERWERPGKGPWRESSPFVIEILDIKDFWVRFGYVYEATEDKAEYVAGDERCTFGQFADYGWVREGKWPPS